MATKASSVELLWGQRERPSRGPKPGLSLDGIVRAAIAIADADGLEAVSMQRVANEFGFTTMSLYRYVPGKAELIDLMIDTAVGPPPDLSAISGGWRPKLAEWARLTWRFFLEHQWFLGAAMHGMMGPNQLGWLEEAVAALSGNGLVGQELLEAVLVVNGHVHSMAQFAGRSKAEDEAWTAAITTALTTNSDRFPALTAAIADGAFGPDEEDGGLEFGLARVLDGIEVLIKGKGGVPRKQPKRQ
jgi:AcrR family transcriptional regulator